MKQCSLPVENYQIQAQRWPQSGRHILASFDDTSIVVYQAYRPSIGNWAIAHGKLGGPDFSFQRMSWIKPNFLWMMYRSGWGTKEGQEVVIGLRLKREFFDRLLVSAVASTFDPGSFESSAAWQNAVRRSDVRRQWDPDHRPTGGPTERRAIQLGLRGESLTELVESATLEVIDMSSLVCSGRMALAEGRALELETPLERVYLQTD